MEEAKKEIEHYNEQIKQLKNNIIETTKNAIIKMADDEKVSLDDAIMFVNHSLKKSYLIMTNIGLLMLENRPRGFDLNYSSNVNGILNLFGEVTYDSNIGDMCKLHKKWFDKKGDMYESKFDRITQSYK